MLLLAALGPLLATLPAILPSLDDDPLPRQRWDRQTYVVHEWGTFTHVQDAEGNDLLGLTHDPASLPPFVYDLRDRLGISAQSIKLETPVLYFYAPQRWELSVRVDFPRGLLTQWYPAASYANLWGRGFRAPVGLPELLAAEPREGFAGKLRKGFLAWGRQGELAVLAPSERPELPAVEEEDPWAFARRVEANDLEVLNHGPSMVEMQRQRAEGEEVQDVPPTREHERYLFYRGLGDFALPLACAVRYEHERGDHVQFAMTLTNALPEEPLTGLVAVLVRDGRAAFAPLADLDAPRDERRVTFELASRGTTDRALAAHLVELLTDAGLYADEAVAMVETWKSGWFGDEGLRLLYLAPRALVDRELPLTVTPSSRFGRVDGEWTEVSREPDPSSVERVFVGRLDLLAPSQERALADVLAGLDSADEALRLECEARVEAWGRYADPFLARAAELGATPEAIERARQVSERWVERVLRPRAD